MNLDTHYICTVFLFITACAYPIVKIDPASCVTECVNEIETEDSEEHCDDAMKDRECCQWGDEVMPCDVVDRIMSF